MLTQLAKYFALSRADVLRLLVRRASLELRLAGDTTDSASQPLPDTVDDANPTPA